MATVLLTSYSGVLGGAERALLDLAGTLPHELWLACPHGPLADEAARREIRLRPLRGRALELRGRGSGGSTPLAALAPLAASGRLLGHALELRSAIAELAPELVI